MNLIDRLRHLVEVVEVLDGGPAATALEVGNERRPIHRSRDHVVAAEHDRPRIRAGLELEGGGSLGNGLQNEVAVEPDPHVVDLHPRLLEDLPGPVVEEVDSDLLQDVHCLPVDRLDIVRAEDVIRLEPVLPHRASIVQYASYVLT